MAKIMFEQRNQYTQIIKSTFLSLNLFLLPRFSPHVRTYVVPRTKMNLSMGPFLSKEA